MRRSLRFAVRALVAAFVLIVISFIAVAIGALFPASYASSSEPLQSRSDSDSSALDVPVRIYLLYNALHTDIAVPVTPEVLARFRFISDAGFNLDEPGVYWIIFGWGSRAFFINTPNWGEMKPGPTLKALMGDASVMHMYRAGWIDDTLEGVSPIDVSNDGFTSMLEAFEDGFRRKSSMGPAEMIPDAGFSRHDAFFEGVEEFHALNGCNTWTARMLRAAGLKTGIWTPSVQTLRFSLWLHNEPRIN